MVICGMRVPRTIYSVWPGFCAGRLAALPCLDNNMQTRLNHEGFAS